MEKAEDDTVGQRRWRTSRSAAARAEISRTRNILNQYRQQQDDKKHVAVAGRADLLNKQAHELRRRFIDTEAHSERDHGTCSDACNNPPPSCDVTQEFGFAGATAPNFHLAQNHKVEDVQKFLHQSGLSKQDIEDMLVIASPLADGQQRHEETTSCVGISEGKLSAQYVPTALHGHTGLPFSNHQPPEPATAVDDHDVTSSGHRLLPGSPPASMVEPLLLLATRRINAWEVRRLLACRDCTAGSQLQRWCLALAVPYEQILAAGCAVAARNAGAGNPTPVALLVQQSRQNLLLRVHPDKNALLDSQLAAAAFVFLQEASEGLLAHLKS